MFRRTLRFAMIVGLIGPASASAAVVATPIGGAFTAPTYMTAPPGDTQHLFVVQQPGQIKLVDLGSPATSTTFMDISSEVEFAGGEQGLLSMAFAPDYATSRRFYVYYTDKNCPDSPGCDEHVSEFTANADLQSASPASEQVLLTIPHPDQSNHNGGQLQFGPDGDLYISVGDGGGGNDTESNAQKTSTLLGKILRIAPGTSSYSIPAGNPFASSTLCSTGPTSAPSTCPEIWAYGLRNPWRFSFDSATGDLVIGDVGQDRNEEVDFAHPGQNVGANYGWPCFEGFELNASRPGSECSPPLPSPVVAPVLTYPHPANCAGAPFCGAGIIGGYVMHDPTLPSLNGCYVFGDLSTSDLRVVRLAQPLALGGADLGPQIGNLSSFGEDAAGHLYAADIGSGVVSELTSDGNAATNPTCPPAPVTGGPPPPPRQLPFNTVPPRILGRVTPGSKLTCAPGSWTAATTFAYQWLINGSSRVTGQNYRPRNADVGHLIGCAVTATNADGSALALSGPVRVADHTPPKLAALTLSPAAFRKRAIVRFRLDERATITVTVQRIGRGHRITGSRRVMGKPGVNRFAFTGRIGGHSLAPGRYRLLLRARDRHGNVAKPVRVRFSIRR